NPTGHIWAESWNQGAIYSSDGMTIQFDRGTVWQRDLGEPDVSTVDRSKGQKPIKRRVAPTPAPVPAARTAVARTIYDGNWSVVIITQSGKLRPPLPLWSADQQRQHHFRGRGQLSGTYLAERERLGQCVCRRPTGRWSGQFESKSRPPLFDLGATARAASARRDTRTRLASAWRSPHLSLQPTQAAQVTCLSAEILPRTAGGARAGMERRSAVLAAPAPVSFHRVRRRRTRISCLRCPRAAGEPYPGGRYEGETPYAPVGDFGGGGADAGSQRDGPAGGAERDRRGCFAGRNG